MSRNYDLYLEDIVAAADRIASYVEGVTRSKFEADQMRIDAVIRNLGIIGEATKQIPDVIREKAPSIAWHNIAGLRNKVIHVYFNVDMDIIWDAVQSKLPPLKAQIQQLIKERSE